MKIRMIIFFVVVSWTALIVSSYFWNYSKAKEEQKRIALQSARSFFDQVLITRHWNAHHGGLYAPVTRETKPNPYLDVPRRDIQIDDHLTLTKINPAYMTRQISEIAQKEGGIQFHITSLNPIRPQNEPTAREKNFLQLFEQGVREKGTFIRQRNKTIYFYMAPLITQKACLQCHAKQGYEEGEIRGGISVTLPFVMNIPFFSLFFGHLGIGIAGLGGIFLAAGKLNRAYRTIRNQAVFDVLTGVPNRRRFSEIFIKEYKRSQRHQESLAIIMCDIDHFKIFNDTYGHGTGDECLKKVAECIQSCLKRPEDFCARYGGEEFVIILPRTKQKGAIRVAEGVRTAVENQKIPNQNAAPFKIVTLSLGVATTEDTIFDSHEDLVKHADLSLYEAKRQGRNRVEANPSFFRE